jgi:DNA-binding NtrC family response regulator
VLADPTVSRLHCELVREGAVLRLRDLGSKNGCWIDVCRVGEAVLAPGARMRIGSTVVVAEVARARLRRPVWRGGDRLDALIGASAPMQTLFARMVKVAMSDVAVRIHGETGTGKELVARAIHAASDRHAGPFVVVDGASLSHQLADVELFGHERGAFTGAHGERAGAFERAHRGTVFIDEIGELPLEVQPKLLRALEDGTVQRIGGSARISVDVRVICATHRALERLVNQGAFREDLLYRLGAVALDVPPLRERGGDVARIARDMVHGLAPGDTRAAAAAAVAQALEERRGYAWPGNVRELRSFVRRVVALGVEGAGVGPAEDAEGLRVRCDLPLQEARAAFNRAFERQYLAQVLDEAGGSVAAAAVRAGVSRTLLYRMLDKLGLKARSER